MAESIEIEDIEQSASLVKTGMELLESWEKICDRNLETRRLAINEVEHRQRWGNIDGLLFWWKDFLGDIDADLLDSKRELREVKSEVEEVKEEHEALLAVYKELSRIKTTIIGDENE